MALKEDIVYTAYDDLTAEKIEDFDPEKHIQEFEINGKTYELVLTDESLKTVTGWIDNLIKGAKVKEKKAKPATGGASVLKEKARRAKVVESWNAKHPADQRKRYSASLEA